MGLFTNKAIVTEESVLSDETIYEFAQEIESDTGYVLVAEGWKDI